MASPKLQKIIDKLTDTERVAARYRIIIFVVLVVAVYGFLVYRINSLSNAQPSSQATSAQVNPIAGAHIDKATVAQLQQLQDNSVSVQTLFNNARNNPFQE